MNSVLIKNVILNGKTKDIFIEGNRIKRIGKNINLRAKEKIDGKEEKAILPGLINCHTHAAMTLFRGYGDDLPLKEWLENKIWPLEKKMDGEDAYWGTKLAILEMIKTGTTTFNDMYWWENWSIEAVEEMGIRAVIGLVLLDFSPIGSKKNLERYWSIFKKRKLKNITFSIAPHAIYTVSRENLIWAKNFAKKNNLILHTHLSETEKEAKDCLEKYKMRPVEYLEKIGFLGNNCVLAHSIWLSDNEIKILGSKKCNAVYNPCSNMKLASGIFPYQKLKKAGTNIVLGTDGAASNNSLDMFSEMKFASLLQRVNQKDPTLIPVQEIFETATKNGAKALKINAGEIKVGKLADLILIDLNNVSFKPGHNFVSDAVYSASGDYVSDLICNGKILMRDKKVKDEEKIKKEATKRAKRLIKF